MAKMKNMIIAIGLDQKALRKMNKQLRDTKRNFKRDFGAIADSVKNAGRTMSMAITAPLAIMGVASVKAFDQQAKAIAQVEAGLMSTGAAVGYTSEQLQKMAADLQSKTIFGDEEILKDATSQLLTFTNIAGTNFARTQKVALDLATRLDGDLKSASIQLGKALNDPVANLTALSRAGIQFSSDQKAVIKSLTETGRLAEAQTIILDELEKQYGGSAEAAAAAGMGPFKQLANSVSDMSEAFGGLIAEALTPLIGHIKSVVTWVSSLNSAQKGWVLGISAVAAAIGPLLLGIGMMLPAISRTVGMLKLLTVAQLKANAAMLLNPYLAVAAALAGAVWWIRSHNKESKKMEQQSKATATAYDKLTGSLNLTQSTKSTEDLTARLADLNTQLDASGKKTSAAAAGADIYARVNAKGAHAINLSTREGALAETQSTKTATAIRDEANATQERIAILAELQRRREAAASSGGKISAGALEAAKAAAKQQKEDLKAWDAWLAQLGKLQAAEDTYNANKTAQAVAASTAQEARFQEFMRQGIAEQAWKDNQAAEDVARADATAAAQLGFAQSLSGSIQGIFSKLAAGTQSFGQIMGDMLQQLLIKLAAMAAAFLIISILTGGAGGAAMNFGDFMKAGMGIPKLASGGVVSGPTLAVVGDNKNAMADPEVVAPLSTLKGMMGGQGGGHLTGRISGRDIVLASHRDQRGARRTYTSELI